ncbi:asparagine synthetase [Thermococcus guaymasensis DSM 11113]|uniref:Asparagine synthetase n=1 Tax=Thermococcus guaymasensis DSM 11113 TaxID=1432656 RepID=A0A0X1KJ29_9EURY|nr:asparagine synthetase A [Thermococcus guaymasensis]AJC71284.1 asparagine synthetase [Thermococcus guaymasensis DSM 11113]
MNALQIVSRKIDPIVEVQTRAIAYLTGELSRKGFRWLLPVMLSTVTDPLWPDPSAESAIRPPEIEAYGSRLRLMHSMILHKQMAVAMGIDKLFILSPNVRLESRSADDGRHAYEFTQLDFEIAHASMDDVMGLIEELIVGLFRELRPFVWESFERELPKPRRPFKRFTLEEIREEFGSEEEASRELEEPFWIIDIEREFYDREDPERPGHFRNYDLYLPEGYGEVSSGGEREWEYEVIVRKMKRAGISLEAFRPYLEVAKAGLLKPSAGAGIGVERLIRYIVGAKHIAEVQPFPRIPGVPAVI